MNKRIFKALVVLSLSAFASTVFAANTLIPSTGTSIGSIGFQPSNRVKVRVTSTAGNPLLSPPTSGSYAVGAAHDQGSRTFATNSVASIIYWKDTIDAAVPVTSTDTFSAPTWTSM